MNDKIGSYHWIKNSQGRLSWQEKIKLTTASLLPTTLHLLNTIHSPKNTSLINFDDIIIPDTPYVKDAINHVGAELNASVLAHSWRSFYWGAAIAISQKQDYDAEVFLLSALFHDVGLGKAHPEGCQCFCYHSAQYAQQWSCKQHYPQDKTELMLDSICLHMNGSPTSNEAIEIRMLQWGTSCDVIGQQLHKIPLHLQMQVLQQFPLLNFHSILQTAISFEKQQHPHSRTALLSRLGLDVLINQHAKRVKHDI